MKYLVSDLHFTLKDGAGIILRRIFLTAISFSDRMKLDSLLHATLQERRILAVDWPIYEAKQIIVGNLESPVGIVTLWSNREVIAEQIGDPNLYCAIGTLYNRKLGIDLLFRNLLARPTIQHLVICGHDRARSGEALVRFFTYGFSRGNDINGNPKWRIELGDGDYGLIDIEVEQEALELLRRNVAFLDLRGLQDGTLLRATLRELNRSGDVGPYTSIRTFPKNVPEARTLPAPESGRVFRAPTVVGAWLQAIKEIYRFGTVGETHYNPATEVLNLITVITAEDPDRFFVPEWLPIGMKEIEAYCEQVLTPVLSPGARYGYGNRIFEYFGYDELQEAVQKLARDPDSKSAVIGIWDPRKDVGDLLNPKSPCINHIWLRFRKGKLFLTATIRSNDMGEAYLGNGFSLRRLQAFAARLLQEMLPPDVSVALGDLVINSQSAHLYESSWANVEETLSRHWKEVMQGPAVRQDPYGSFRISLEEREIVVTHLSSTDEPIGGYRGKTALQLTTTLVEASVVSEPYHAAYLGRELQKAELALLLGVSYVQDSPLFPAHGPRPQVSFK